jgi:hypothetical protein
MPKELTHWLVADQALAGLTADSRLRKIIEAHRSAYLGGAVLPDTLLHLFRGSHAPAALTLAHAFHDTDGNSFAPLIHTEGCFPGGLPPALLACLLGVITHIETDIIFHPFVYALAESAGIGRHYQIETEIDCYFLRNGTISANKHLADLIHSDAQETLVDACALLFDPDNTLPRPALELALSLHCRFQSMYDNTFWKLAVRIIAMVIDSPLREQRHLFYPMSCSSAPIRIENSALGWRHSVSGELQHRTLDELLNEVVRRTTVLFTLIEEKGSLTAALLDNPGENLLTGLHGVCRNAMDCRASN